MNLEQRIEYVLQRVKDGYFDQSMPPEETDIDMVLIDCLKEIKRLNGILESDDFVLVDKSKLENWYFDEYEGLWLDRDGIDGGLSQIDIGEVAEIKKQKQYSIEIPSVFVTLPWGDDEVSYWQEYETKEEAEEVAKHCKTMFDSQ